MFIPEKMKKLGFAPVALAVIWVVVAAPWSAAGAAPVEVQQEESELAAFVRATGHSFDAVVTDYEVDIRWEAVMGEVVSAVLTFDFADVDTGRDRRDREMREWIDYESHPTVVFVLEEVLVKEEGRVARGSLSMHGEEEEVEFPFSIEREGERVRITGETTIDHRDWGLERIRAFLFMTVDPELDIRFDLRATVPEN